MAIMQDLICYWYAFWDGVAAWHWTPGWGNLFTVIAAVAAILVGASINLLTLRSANQKFEQGRVDARNVQLMEEIGGLLSASGERGSQQAVYVQRLMEIVRGLLPNQPPVILDPLRWRARSALSETISDTFTRIGTHLIAINLLTDNPRIIEQTAVIQAEEFEQKKYLESLIEKIGTQPTPVQDQMSVRLEAERFERLGRVS